MGYTPFTDGYMAYCFCFWQERRASCGSNSDQIRLYILYTELYRLQRVSHGDLVKYHLAKPTCFFGLQLPSLGAGGMLSHGFRRRFEAGSQLTWSELPLEGDSSLTPGGDQLLA